jgi:thymidylate synthase ThyX
MRSKLEKVRQEIGTLPKRTGLVETRFYPGVTGIKVRLVDWPANPFKALVTMVTSTWGGTWDTNRWAKLSPESRLHVILSVLNRKTLPNAMESLSFTFEVSGLSRSAFDQIARARIGAVFASMGWRDNEHGQIGFRVPQSIWRDPHKRAVFIEGRERDKEDFMKMLAVGGNWQDARAALPISATHRFTCSFTFMALQNFMSKRLRFNEQEDTVATAWLMREVLKEKFPLFAQWLRPADDWVKRCLEHDGNEFGNLFRCSGRWPCEQASDEFTFASVCSDRDTLCDQLGIHIPLGDEDYPDAHVSLDNLELVDRLRCYED